MPDLRVLALLLTLLLSACASPPSPDDRRQLALDLALPHAWQSVEIDALPFTLQAFIPAQFANDQRLVLYIEGDGFAWANRSHPSSDPTPLNPLALRLALAQPEGNAAYLARPCQYLGAHRGACTQRYWTDARFAEEVVASLDQAISLLKTRANASELTLVGYSGGGALALLLAARRDDVRRIVSVSGNLDHAAWTDYHRVQPLKYSLNPLDVQAELATVEQWHLIGANDRVTPPALVERFVASYTDARTSRVWVMPGYDHACCWAQHWPELWRRIEATQR
ncbi:dienelactone hydrolase family protein [Aquipseudomonas ullengensis]|uniref:Dienelactone hydrolase family protein n=1 Tax=Aquipseudomonas ullengensis TaxID=2759166 RepID=A0A7W4LL07_9GAMM|nr:dienelactone hydrolase family protein [Pseudomonas ullengensis]MBB2495073.1 dienelactone hydrolase family protein [Pseudomonas ullengensis]